MGDHRATYRLQFEMHGHKANSGEAWVNWDWSSGCDRRVIEWFEEQTRIAMNRWDDEQVKREDEQRKQKRHAATLAVAQAIFGADPNAPDAMSWELVGQTVRDHYLRLAEAAQNVRSDA